MLIERSTILFNMMQTFHFSTFSPPQFSLFSSFPSAPPARLTNPLLSSSKSRLHHAPPVRSAPGDSFLFFRFKNILQRSGHGQKCSTKPSVDTTTHTQDIQTCIHSHRRTLGYGDSASCADTMMEKREEKRENALFRCIRQLFVPVSPPLFQQIRPLHALPVSVLCERRTQGLEGVVVSEVGRGGRWGGGGGGGGGEKGKR
jgi:hypothetical protein